MSNTPAMYALVIGIDQYDPRSLVPTLRGCVLDATSIENLLQNKFGAPAANLLKLTNEQATRNGILQAFRTHLIGHAKQWQAANQGDPAPEFIFHYSGHGSQARDESGTEPDGMDETLVAYDSRLPGVFDIKDWELGQLIEELNKYTDNVTIILDCCHSGSGTRDLNPNVAQTRRCPPDLRPQPTQRPPTQGATRGVSASAWDVTGKHVLLAGCRDKEESNEYPVNNGAQRTWQGAMTYFLVQELTQAQPDRKPTYRELHERVSSQVNSAYANQTPQCEGDIQREVFGAVRPVSDTFFNVIDKRDGLIWIDGGLAHGITEGSELTVYAPETRTLAQAGAPLATLAVTEEGAVQSGCQPTQAGINIPLHARCVIERINYGDMQSKVLLDIADATLRAAVEKRLGPQEASSNVDDISRYVKLIDASAAPDFRITTHAERLEIQDNSTRVLVAPFKLDDLDGLAADLAHLTRYRNSLAIRNAAPDAELNGQVTLAIKKLAFDPNTQDPIAVDLPQNPGGELMVEVGDRVVFEIANRSNQPLYFALFDFSSDYEVAQLYPRVAGAHEPLAPRSTFHLGLSRKRSEQYSAALPDGMPEGKDSFKVIATVADTNFETLQQGPLKSSFATRKAVSVSDAPPSALDSLLAQALNGEKRRAFGPPQASAGDQWTTAKLEIVTVQSLANATRSLTGGARTVLPNYPIAFEAPTGFTGQVRVLTTRQSTRAAAGDNTDLQPPPGLAPYGDLFQPLAIGSTRATAPTGTVIEIEADDASQQAITPATPLNVHLNWDLDDNTAGILALAYDGNFFYPVGRAAGAANTVPIEWLPQPDAPGLAPLRSTRSIGRIVKLYLYKLVGKAEPSLGLHQVHFVTTEGVNREPKGPEAIATAVPGGEVRYKAVTASELKPKARVALAVHGFGSETSAMAAWLTSIWPQHGAAYDHVLAYDYESFNTAIRDNGHTLANALHDLGFSEQDSYTLDIFAHSMGTLVTRSLVEIWGGDTFVDRCFLAGPPNQGTRLADVKRFVPWLSTLLLNQGGFLAPTLLAGWVLNKASNDAVGPEDLRSDSKIVQELNTATKVAKVPYFILAGDNQFTPEAKSAWDRLRQKVMQNVDVGLDLIFGDQNDKVIGVKSMLGLRNGRYPANLLKTKEVTCDHFSYFADDASQQQLIEWVKG